MAYTTINKSSEHFNTLLWSGDGNTTKSFTGVGFAPDWIWVKTRNQTSNHLVEDKVRGVNKILLPSANNAEVINATQGYTTSFDSDGHSWTTGASGVNNFNASGSNYVNWNWKANGQGSANTDGSINTTYTSVNTTAGFSICKYTGNGTTGATIGHGLGAVPKWIIVKRLDSTTNWQVYHSSMGAEKFIELNNTGGQSDSDVLWNDTAPTNQVFSLGNYSHVNYNGSPHIAYCFAEKTGYSKFGSYTGNGNTDGTFVYTGFKPAFVILKRTDATNNWHMVDNKRDTFNPTDLQLYPNLNNSEYAETDGMDFLSNGFKIRESATWINASGGTYLYMAFAEAPLVGSNNIPCTAR